MQSTKVWTGSAFWTWMVSHGNFSDDSEREANNCRYKESWLEFLGTLFFSEEAGDFCQVFFSGGGAELFNVLLEWKISIKGPAYSQNDVTKMQMLKLNVLRFMIDHINKGASSNIESKIKE